MASFTFPRDLYHGKGALEALKAFTGKRAMICAGGGSPIDAAKAMWIKTGAPQNTLRLNL